jgi:hypothetical protein
MRLNPEKAQSLAERKAPLFYLKQTRANLSWTATNIKIELLSMQDSMISMIVAAAESVETAKTQGAASVAGFIISMPS